jgi:hypothetical protein
VDEAGNLEQATVAVMPKNVVPDFGTELLQLKSGTASSIPA